MPTELEDLKVLQQAELIADGIWAEVSRWDIFARDVVGKQLACAADSIGANIAEAYGRYHYGDKVLFLYYARGSLYETKFWLNRARIRNLMAGQKIMKYAESLSLIAAQINAFAKSLKAQKGSGRSIKEPLPNYAVEAGNLLEIFTSDEIQELSTVSNL
jgi:four helix bundle protein